MKPGKKVLDNYWTFSWTNSGGVTVKKKKPTLKWLADEVDFLRGRVDGLSARLDKLEKDPVAKCEPPPAKPCWLCRLLGRK